MANPENPDEAECRICFDTGYPPGSYDLCVCRRPIRTLNPDTTSRVFSPPIPEWQEPQMSDENESEPTVLACGCPLQIVHDEGHQEGCAVPAWAERHGAEVQVAFTVPVEVVVDLTTGKVTQVVTIDEAVNMDTLADDLPDVNMRTSYTPVAEADGPVTAETIRKIAGEIADGSDVEWPAWQAGW